MTPGHRPSGQLPIWTGVLLIEAGGQLLPHITTGTLLLIRCAQLCWVGALLIRQRALPGLGLISPDRAQWRLLAGTAAVAGAIALALLRSGTLDGWPRPVADPAGVVLTLLVAPLLEELLFRGLLYPLLRGVFGRWPAIVADALLFALAHGHLPSPQLIGGLLFAWIYAHSGNLWLPIMLHAAANAAVLLLASDHFSFR